MQPPVNPAKILLAAILLGGGLPAPAHAQGDPITDRLIRELRPSGSRGMRADPYAGRAAEPAAPAARTADAVAPGRAAPAEAAPRPAPLRVALTTTAPPGVPASSLTVLFETGSATLAASAQVELVALGRALSSPALLDSRFRIEGHTDRVGSELSNQVLSERRAATVRDYLVQQANIDEARLVIAGLGEAQPLVRTPDEVANPQNRRVQVLNIGSVRP